SDDDEEFGTCEPGGMTGGSMRVCRDGVLRCRGGARLECVRRAAPRASETCNNGIDDDDDDEGWDDEPPRAGSPASGPAREQLMGSPMLLSSLEQAAGPANPHGHFLLAALFRCGRPSPYLYEESLKGRVLTAIERGWVEDYLRLEPQYRKYEAHLKAAALGGVRAAALEYGTTFESPE
ncbi:MAG: hypothetical protein JNG88_19790, partial [Phycisphaerales bacterium]|nr:hypothetical protein [Phycisphaerales bacterium]